MSRRRFQTPVASFFAAAALSLVMHQGICAAAQGGKAPAKPTRDQLLQKFGKVPTSDQKAAAKRARDLGLLPGVAGVAGPAAAAVPLPGLEGPGGVPHYFGPYGNWAYSPLPTRGIGSVTVTAPGTGYTAPVVTITDVYGTGTATATAAVDALGAITAITVDPGSAGFHVPFVTITDPTGTGATATATLDNATVTGGLRKFVDKMPQLTPAGANSLVTPNRLGLGPVSTDGQYIPLAVSEPVTFSGQTADYYEIALVEFYEKMHSDLPPTLQRGYVQLETPANAPPAGPSKHVALTYLNGSPIYYPGTTNQVFAVDYPHYLGPTIVARGSVRGSTDPSARPVPVRIKFYNLLPVGPADATGRRPGDLFLPVDETVPGSGLGPAGPGNAGDTYTQNRAAVHLHGNNTVWISDGTPHQWITPAGETTPYPTGVSVRNVPDMPDPGPGAETIFYTNAMSARLMFYHDHALGITRINVYAGSAAGYALTDAVDQDMINGTNVTGVNPGLLKVLPDLGIPLVIQDRTFVDADTIFAQDPTWNWGTGPRDPATGNITGAVTGDLWTPHVYLSAQNPWDLSGLNAFGRWHYGPWFHPPTPTCVGGLPVGCVETGPVPNEYYQPICDGLPDPVHTVCTAPWEPPERPGVPNPSIPGEAFNDTPIVNGTAYPYLDVEPRPYRFRVLNASNDRFLNLQLYVAADKTTPTTAGTTGTVLCDGLSGAPVANCTEVKMRLVTQADLNQTADTPSGLPDETTKGPAWIQIGTEGGFMPAPTVVPIQPVGWNMDPTAFNVGVVNQHSLLLGSAERADVVVDFSAFAGQTLILYNDAPAAFPAGVATYDYFTGVGDQVDAGGAPDTLPGYGPNTRTVMQIRVGTTVAPPPPAGTGVDTSQVNFANLQAVFAKGDTTGCPTPGPTCKRGVFEVSQDPIIIPQAAYNSAYNNTFPSTAAAQFLQIADTAKTFQPINTAGQLLPAVTIDLEQKAMHDEMGGVYDTQFGRMSGMLGLSNPTSPVHVLTPYGYASPPTDVIRSTGDIETTQIGSLPDGTQIWRIFHNGVDTHTIHTHLFTSQLINRIGQDGIMQVQDPIELGFKDTFRINPLEITFLAMRPILPTPAEVPFEVPDSVRLIDPTLPEGATLVPPAPAGWFDPAGNAITEILNHYVNFGWEYVWHCHILAHEEMDMMHSLVAAVPPRASTGLIATWNGSTGGSSSVTLNWTDNSSKEAGFSIQRAADANFTMGLTSFNVAANLLPVPSVVTYVDKTIANDTMYWYRVTAIGSPVGDILTAGFPTMSADSVSNTVSVQVGAAATAPNPPTNLADTLQAGPQVNLAWRDNATNETGFAIGRCSFVAPATSCTSFAQIAVAPPKNNTGNTSYVDATVIPGNNYSYGVAAVNGATLPPYTYVPFPTAISVPAIPAAPTGFTVSVAKATGKNYTATLSWATATNPSNFTIQRATNATFTTNLASFTPAGTARSLVQTVSRNTTYYYRIRANNSISGSSGWTNALPFPIRTGP